MNVTTAGLGSLGPWGALGFHKGHTAKGRQRLSGGTTCFGSSSEKLLGEENAGTEVGVGVSWASGEGWGSLGAEAGFNASGLCQPI